MRSRRLLAIGLGAALAAPVAAPSPVGGAPTRVSVESVAWLQSQQQPDGGFELLGVPGFETADAILGLAAWCGMFVFARRGRPVEHDRIA